MNGFRANHGVTQHGLSCLVALATFEYSPLLVPILRKRGGKQIALDLQCNCELVQRKVETITVDTPAGPQSLQRPKVTHLKLDRELKVADGGTALIYVGQFPDWEADDSSSTGLWSEVKAGVRSLFGGASKKAYRHFFVMAKARITD